MIIGMGRRQQLLLILAPPIIWIIVAWITWQAGLVFDLTGSGPWGGLLAVVLLPCWLFAPAATVWMYTRHWSRSQQNVRMRLAALSSVTMIAALLAALIGATLILL